MRDMLGKFAGDDVKLQNDQTMENFNAKYVNPLSDWGFKRLFGTEMNKDLLLGFLRSLFPERDISDIAYLRNERQNLSERERDSVFDVVCTDPRGSQFVVEMQKRTQRYFRDRALYYAAYPIIEQAPKGSWNYRLKPVCVVGILNFAMEHEYGPEAGLAEGETKGRAEGKVEGKAEVARKMMAAGMPAEQISEFTGLTAEQLSALK